MTNQSVAVSNQEAFSQNWTHFVTNKGKPSVDATEKCRYRGDNGAKCGIGLLIADKKYSAAIEGVSVGYSFDLQEKLLHRIMVDSGFQENQFMFLSLLQACHDNAAIEMFPEGKSFHERIEIRFRQLAKIYDLTIPAV